MKVVAQQQIIIIHTLLPAEVKADKELKAALIAQYTGSPDKTSTRDLSYSQAYELIKDLQESKNQSPVHQRSDKMRKKIISMAHELGWQYYSENRSKLCADMNAINAWCIKYGHKHKNLDDYTYVELPTLVSQFEQMYKGEIAKK